MKVLTLMAPLSAALGVVSGAGCIRKLKTPDFILMAYLALCLLTELISRIPLVSDRMENNVYLLPFFALGESVLFTILLTRGLDQVRTLYFLLAISIPVVVFAVDVLIITQVPDVTQFQSYTKITTNLLIICLTLHLLLRGLKRNLKLLKDYFWLLLVVLVYFSVNLFLFLSFNFLINNELNVVIWFWLVNVIFNSGFYLLITYFIWKRGKAPKYLRSGSQ